MKAVQIQSDIDPCHVGEVFDVGHGPSRPPNISAKLVAAGQERAGQLLTVVITKGPPGSRPVQPNCNSKGPAQGGAFFFDSRTSPGMNAKLSVSPREGGGRSFGEPRRSCSSRLCLWRPSCEAHRLAVQGAPQQGSHLGMTLGVVFCSALCTANLIG